MYTENFTQNNNINIIHGLTSCKKDIHDNDNFILTGP